MGGVVYVKRPAHHLVDLGGVASLHVILHPVSALSESALLSRGFGFITFKDPETVSKALSIGEHWLDKKRVSGRSLTMPLATRGRFQYCTRVFTARPGCSDYFHKYTANGISGAGYFVPRLIRRLPLLEDQVLGR